MAVFRGTLLHYVGIMVVPLHVKGNELGLGRKIGRNDEKWDGKTGSPRDTRGYFVLLHNQTI